MKNPTHRRGRIRAYLYTGFLIFALLVSSASNYYKYSYLQRVQSANTRRSLAQLGAYLSSINTDLTKGLYVTTGTMLETMSNELTRDAAGAKSALASLPLSDSHLDNTYKFLSQVGAFVTSLDRKLNTGGSISDEERQNMLTLIKISKSLSDAVSDITVQLESGEMNMQTASLSVKNSDLHASGLSPAFSDAEQSVKDYPTLIYDGPFSDSILERESQMLKNSAEISQDEALGKAAEFTGLDKNNLKFSGESQGRIPCYLFSNDSFTAAVSKNGGYVVYILGSSYAGEEKISIEQATENARAFLDSRGYLYMEDNYYSVNDGIATINFASVQNGITCYADLIKVSISLETGNVLSFDASGFIMNHIQRDFPEPKITESEARSKLSPLLKEIACKRAIIPTEYATEQDCYEFRCVNDSGQEFLVYIDTATGMEDNILILLHADGGILTK
ncbi:MAG: germination protein YpeB [Clostridia bacterium]|nr:germination protein YpeB [Clostridia bacterium]